MGLNTPFLGNICSKCDIYWTDVDQIRVKIMHINNNHIQTVTDDIN